MPQRSLEQLMTILRSHGLTVSLLELVAQHCERHETGYIALHTRNGQIMSYDQRVTGSVTLLNTRSVIDP